MKPSSTKFRAVISEITKIYNQSIYSKFESECLRIIKKHMVSKSDDVKESHCELTYDKMFRFLFHGTKETDPKLIYNSEDGLDFRFSHKGLMGQGIYFAEDPSYSHSYTYRMREDNLNQMFLCIVNLGKYKALQTNNSELRMPPLVEGSKSMRYDSVYNKPLKHFIVYDNSQAYPGYLITYKC